MNAEWPTARFQEEDQPRSPGYRNRLSDEDNSVERRLSTLAMDNSIEDRLRLIERKIRLKNVKLEPPIAESEVEAFEQMANVTLPDGYRRFVTEIGNGGDGPPTYGLLPFPDVLWDGDLISKPFPFREPWVCTDPEQEDDVCSQTLHGNIRLGEDGCEMHWILIVVGCERGKVWNMFENNVEPCCDRRDFLAWYDDWLNGRNDRSIPQTKAISDEEFFETYTEIESLSETQNCDGKRKWWQIFTRG